MDVLLSLSKVGLGRVVLFTLTTTFSLAHILLSPCSFFLLLSFLSSLLLFFSSYILNSPPQSYSPFLRHFPLALPISILDICENGGDSKPLSAEVTSRYALVLLISVVLHLFVRSYVAMSKATFALCFV